MIDPSDSKFSKATVVIAYCFWPGQAYRLSCPWAGAMLCLIYKAARTCSLNQATSCLELQQLDVESTAICRPESAMQALLNKLPPLMLLKCEFSLRCEENRQGALKVQQRLGHTRVFCC
jgi:hypothetical protein